MARSAYLSLIVTLFIYGMYNLSFLVGVSSNKQKMKFKRKSFSETLINEESEEIKGIDYKLEQAGLSISGKQYQVIRYSVVAIMALLWTTNLILYKESSVLIQVAIGVFIITIPKDKLWKINSPFSYIMDAAQKEFQRKKDMELYSVVSQLKNICLSAQGNLGTDYILNEIVKYTKYTRPVFLKFISLWNIDKVDEAITYFNVHIGSLLGQELASILYKFDSIGGEELIQQLDLYQNNIRQEKETHRTQIQERRTTVLYFAAVGVVMLVMINLLLTLMFNSMATQINFSL